MRTCASNSICTANCKGKCIADFALSVCFFLPSCPAERLEVLACLTQLQQRHVEVMKVIHATGTPWPGPAPSPAQGPAPPLFLPPLGWVLPAGAFPLHSSKLWALGSGGL